MIKISYEDESLIVVDKQSGLPVVPAKADQRKNLTFFLDEELKTRGLTLRAHPCHRLDKETSGLVIFAKGKKIQKIVMEQFRSRLVRKTYIAFIQGALKNKRGTLRTYIQGAWPYLEKKGKKLAITTYHELCRGKGFSILELKPVTGRTNQIRIQFRDIGHPLLGERRFAFARDWPIKFRRVALHAFKLEFIHPVNLSKISLTSDLPEDMSAFLKKHRICLA